MQRPALVLLLCLLALSATGTVLLCQPWCTPRDSRESEYFLGRVVAECAFDAVSAACGCGLNAGGLEARYSPVGLWVLWSIGVAGAAAYLACGAAVILRLVARMPQARSGREAVTAPGAGAAELLIPILAAALGIALGLSGLVYFAGRAACPTVTFPDTVWLVGGAFFSLGIAARAPDAGTSLMLAFVGVVGALGWMVWLLPMRAVRQALQDVPLGRIVLIYVLWLAAAAGLSCALEQPRGGESIGKLSVSADDGAVPISREPAGSRYVRSLVAVTNAATTGIASEPLSDRALRDGSKAVLVGAMLVGGLLGGPGGGVTISLLVLAIRRKSGRWRPVAAAVYGALGVMTIVVALVLLVLEAQVGSRYQPPPTFADALIEAGSAVGGGGLSSGLVATVTARNLISGIGLGLSQYQIGMFVLALAMVAGRIIPLALLAHYASRERE